MTKVKLPLRKKVGRPRGSEPAQLIRAALANKVYLAVKELERRGTPLSELLADQLDTDPIGSLTKLTLLLTLLPSISLMFE
jgi:hypothetical protein